MAEADSISTVRQSSLLFWNKPHTLTHTHTHTHTLHMTVFMEFHPIGSKCIKIKQPSDKPDAVLYDGIHSQFCSPSKWPFWRKPCCITKFQAKKRFPFHLIHSPPSQSVALILNESFPF